MEEEKQGLLRELQSVDAERREQAAERLWQLWFGAAGPEAEQRLLYAEQCFERKEWDKADEALSSLIEEYPQFAEAWNRRATLRYLQDHFAASLEDCRQTVTLEPDHFGAWHGMGLCFYAMHDFAAAARAFRRALEIQPFVDSNRDLLYECLAKLN